MFCSLSDSYPELMFLNQESKLMIDSFTTSILDNIGLFNIIIGAKPLYAKMFTNAMIRIGMQKLHNEYYYDSVTYEYTVPLNGNMENILINIYNSLAMLMRQCPFWSGSLGG